MKVKKKAQKLKRTEENTEKGKRNTKEARERPEGTQKGEGKPLGKSWKG